MKRIFLVLLLVMFVLNTYSQTTWDVCVAEVYSAGSCSNGLGVFTPPNLTINAGDAIKFTTRFEAIGGYDGTTHDIRFTGSPANNVLLTISTDILNRWTNVTTPPFSTPGTFAMECVDGNHCFFATDFSGWLCTGYSVTVAAGACISSFTASDTIICEGETVAFTNVSTGATGYQWLEDGIPFSTATDTSRTFIAAGTYTISLVASDIPCSDTSDITITVNPNPSVIITAVTNVSCNGACDGAATVTPSGGTPPYTYFWNTFPMITTNPATGLCPGTYCVTVIDSNGCTDTACVTITQPPALTITISSITHVSCNGLCNGSATAIVSGGTPPYTYLWTNGDITQIADSLCAGTYFISVTDSNGCNAVSTVIINQPAPLVASISNFGNVDCNGNCNGYAIVTVTGGTFPYTYVWNPGGQLTQTVTGLCPGTYCVTVTDANGCTDTACVTITQPAPLTGTITSNNVSCFGACDGSATLTAGGGTPGYTYLWNPGLQQTPTAIGLCAGSYTVTITDNNGCSIIRTVIITQPGSLGFNATTTPSTCGYQNGAACVTITGGVFPYTIQWNDPNLTVGTCINSVFAGCYNPVVTDANGCTYTMPVCINDIVGPSIDSVITTDLNCFGDSSGTAQVFVSLGTPAFTYLWKDNTGLTIDSGLIDVVFGLSGGTYTITVIDANGCTESQAFTINEPSPIASAIIPPSNNVSCFGACDGSATVVAGGGIAPYTFLWTPSNQTTATADSLCAGLHNVLITDANGCTSMNSVNILQPAPLQITPTVTNVSCYGGSDGQITLLPSPTGGTPPYAYNWLPGGTGGNVATVTNLPAGSYCVTVTDMNGCTADTCVTITQPQLLTASGTSFPSTCGNCNGVAVVSPQGGTQPYFYQWTTTPVQTNDTATGLCAGTYNVTVTDANGCSLTFPVSVTNIAGILIDSISTTSVLCNGESNGTATVSYSGGTPSYTYLWSNGDTTATATGLSSGVYTVTITDLNGCADSAAASITEPDNITILTFGDEVSICYGDSTLISVAWFGGTNPFTLVWSGGLPDTNQYMVSPPVTTTYTVIITDANGCTASDSVTITVYPPLSSSVIATDDTICEGASATLTALVSGGNGGPYTYTWLNDGSTNGTITASPTTDSTFTVVVSDGGCSVNDTTSAIVVVEICDGVEEQDALKGISVYPNPNTGEFVIEMNVPKAQNVQIKIVNVLGQEVYMEIVAMTNGIYRKHIDMAYYPKGFYTLQIITEEGVFNKKVIVE